MAALVVESGVLALVGSVAVALELRNVGLGDEIAVEVVFDLAADDLDFREVPHPGLAHVAAAAGEVLVFPAELLADVVAQRRNDAVNRTGVLVGLELVLFRGLVVVGAAAVVEKLKLAHAVVRRVDVSRRSADAETVVAVFGHHELEAEDEVTVLLLRDEIAGLAFHLTIGKALENAGFLGIDAVHADRAFPAFEIETVEEAHEAFIDRRGVAAALFAALERTTSGQYQSGGNGNQSFYMHFYSFC